MKNHFKLFIAFTGFIIMSCGNEEVKGNHTDPIANQEDTENEELREELITQLGDWYNYFKMDVPSQMEEMDELNKEAIAQYGYVEEVETENGETEVLEHYLLVMMETKEEIASYELDFELNAISYSVTVMESVEAGADEFELITKSPKVEVINGIDCVINEMRGVIDYGNEEIELYYKLAVFEGEYAFYQLLTWCIFSQKHQFEKDMNTAIHSFVENDLD